MKVDINLIPPEILSVMRALEQGGFEAYLVGGSVRDMLMGKTPHDWDMASSALPEQTLELFPNALKTGLQHGTITVITENFAVELTTFRCDGEYRDGRRPERVSFTESIVEDLARRDFTMNAIALSADGELVDPFDGVVDITHKLVRCVGDPELRFSQDALRILRALRFEAVTGFAAEEGTARAMERLAALTQKLSRERVRDELEGVLMSPRPELSRRFIDLGVLAGSSAGLERLNLLPCVRSERWVAFAAASGVSLRELRLDAQTVKLASTVERLTLPQDAMGIKLIISRLGVEAVRHVCSVSCLRGDADAHLRLERVLASGECCELTSLAVDGESLLELGLRGKQVGSALDMLLRHVIEHPEENDRGRLLELARKI